MIKPESCQIEYLGIKNPENPQELSFEIAGLEYLMAKAKERICSLKQSLILAEIVISEQNKK